MITIFYTPIPNYVNPVEAVIHHGSLRTRCTMVAANPYAEVAKLAPHNPLSTVPAGIREDGEPCYGGPVLYEYLDTLHDRPKLFPTGPNLIFLRRQL